MADGLRGQFLLRDDVIHLNHGPFGACPREVFDAYQCWQLEPERNPQELLARGSTGKMEKCPPRIIGVPQDDLDALVRALRATLPR
jgi:isopenicillin-N epimerase